MCLIVDVPELCPIVRPRPKWPTLYEPWCEKCDGPVYYRGVNEYGMDVYDCPDCDHETWYGRSQGTGGKDCPVCGLKLCNIYTREWCCECGYHTWTHGVQR